MAQHSYKRIADEISESISSGQLKKGEQLQTEKELCAHYGVSRITVQKAMKLLVDDGIIYRVSGKGTFVSDGNSVKNRGKKLLGLIMCSFSAAFGMDIIRAIEKKADETGFSIILKNSYFELAKEKEAIEMLLGLNVAGIIIQPVPDNFYNTEIVRLALKNFPLVTLDREMKGLPIPFTGSDNLNISKKTTRYLLERGHTKICMFTSHLNDSSSLRRRIEGFKLECMGYGVPFAENMLFSDIYSTQMGDLTMADVNRDVKSVKEFLLKNPDFTCAFATEYAIARIVRMACAELGRKIPEDISLITFDNHNDIFRLNQTTYVRQRQNEIASSAVELIERLIDGKAIGGNVLLDADIIDNGSVKRL